MEAYQKSANSEKSAGKHLISVTLLTPEYLVARQMDSSWGKSQVSKASEAYQAGYYISLQISLASPTGTPEDLRKDILNGALFNGQEAFQKRLQFLQNELAAYVGLQCADGREVAPRTYQFNRGYALGGVHSFLFVFPKEEYGKKVSLRGSKFILRDFGIQTGTLKIPVRLAETIALKV